MNNATRRFKSNKEVKIANFNIEYCTFCPLNFKCLKILYQKVAFGSFIYDNFYVKIRFYEDLMVIYHIGNPA